MTQSDKETYVYQDKLPKQPISSLSNTGTKLKRTLDALETHPSFGTEQIDRLKNLWDEFAENEGLKIDEILRINDSKQRDSFVHELWTTMYLADRVPILMNYNPSIAMTPPDPTLSQAQVRFPWAIRALWTRVCFGERTLKPSKAISIDAFMHCKVLLCPTRWAIACFGCEYGKTFCPVRYGSIQKPRLVFVQKFPASGNTLVGGMEVNHESLYN